MKNLNLRDNIFDILNKNTKLAKKYLSAAAAFVIASTPVVGTTFAEGNNTNSNTEISNEVDNKSAGDELAALLSAKPERQHYEMTLEEFENGALAAYNYLKGYIDYEHMPSDVLAAYYLTNYEYISDELTEQLIEKGYIADIDMFDPDGKPEMDRSGWKNINYYNRLVNSINDYNEGRIQREYYEGNISDKSNYIDASVLCAEAYDKEDMHELFEKWYDEYDLTKDTIRSNEAFMEAHKHLTHLNSEEKESQLFDASIGVRFSELKIYGNQVMDFETDYMYENYDYKELDEYFKPDELRQNQWFLRDDFEKQECPDELYFCARMFGEHYHFVRDTVNKELFTVMRNKELSKDKSKSNDDKTLSLKASR